MYASVDRYWKALPGKLQEPLRLLALFTAHFTAEEMVLQQFLHALQDAGATDRPIALADMQAGIAAGMQRGWLAEVPHSRMVAVQPVFAHFLKNEIPAGKRTALRVAFFEFYSAYANYIDDAYLKQDDEDRWEEGLKIVFFEFQNLEQAMTLAIELEEDFLHLFHLLDTGLAADESHGTRLLLARRTMHQLENMASQKPEVLRQKAELRSFTGDVHYRLGQRREAQEAYLAALDFFSENNIPQDEAMVHNNLGNLHADAFRFEEAIGHYQLAIERTLAVPEGEPLMESKPEALLKHYLNLGHCQYQAGRYDEADVAFEKSLGFADPERPSRHLGDLYLRMGLLAYRQKKWKLASDRYVAAADVYNRFNNLFGIGEVHQNMGLLLNAYGKPDKALESYKNAIEVFIHLEAERHQAQIHNNMAHIEYHRFELDAAEYHYRRGYDLAQSCNDGLTAARCTLGLGSVMLEREEHGAATQFLSEARQAFETLGDLDSLADVALNLSTLALSQGNLGEAQTQAEEALRLGSTDTRARANANLALVAERSGDLPACSRFFKKSAALVESSDPAAACEYFQQAGAAARATEDWASAKQCYLEAHRLCGELEHEEGLSFTAWSLGHICDALDEHAAARSFFEKALESFGRTGNEDMQADTANILGIYLGEMGEREGAAEHFATAKKLYEKLEDSEGAEQVDHNLRQYELAHDFSKNKPKP